MGEPHVGVEEAESLDHVVGRGSETLALLALAAGALPGGRGAPPGAGPP